jgi:adenosylhomocysteinase
MKDGAMVCNSGHFDVELELPALKEEAATVTPDVRPHVDEYKLRNGHRIYVLGQGRLVNLASAEGHPPSVMDMSFATQALTTEYCVQNKGKLGAKVHPVPLEVEQFVARHKLTSMGIEIDELTAEQKRYMSGWEQGT